MTTDPAAQLVAEARRAVHEALVVLPAPEADRVRALIADLETAVEGRTAIRLADQPAPAGPSVSATPSHTDRRQRVAAALREHGMVHLGDQVPADEYDCCADAVLAELPPPADRAAVLREADWIEEHCPDHGCVEPETDGCHCEIADRLRRLADEAQQQSASTVHGERVSAVAGYGPDGSDQFAEPRQEGGA